MGGSSSTRSSGEEKSRSRSGRRGPVRPGRVSERPVSTQVTADSFTGRTTQGKKYLALHHLWGSPGLTVSHQKPGIGLLYAYLFFSQDLVKLT